MKLIRYIAAVTFCCALSSCNGFLDVVPKGKLIPKTTDDYDGMVKDPGLVSNVQPLPDVSGDNVEMPASTVEGASKSYSGRAYLWMDNFFDEQADDGGWNKPYSAIYTMNIVIENVMNSTGGTTETKNRVMAEAKVARAFNHWIVASQYAQTYNRSTASTDLGIPVVLKADLEAKPVRATMEQTYAAILNDLNIDPQWLPTTGEPGNKYRITRQAFHAFKARIHLMMGDFDMADAEATLALAINNMLVDYNTFSFKNPVNPYAGVNNRPLYIDSPEVLMYHGSSFGTMASGYNISGHLEALYGSENDLRLKFGFSNITKQGRPTDDGKKRYIQEFTALIGVPEMMLIKAEVLARAGNADALTWVNDLRKKRILTSAYAPLTGSGTDELLKIVLEEREREFPYHGLRWLDMKRLAKEGLYTTSLTRSNSSYSRTLTPNSNLYAFPISLKTIGINPGLKQNPRP